MPVSSGSSVTTRVLAEHLDALKAELERVKVGFRMKFGLEPGWGLNPPELGQVLKQTQGPWHAELGW